MLRRCWNPAFSDVRRLKCLGVKDLPRGTKTLSKQLGYHDLSCRIEAAFRSANNSWSNKQHEVYRRGNTNGLIPPAQKQEYGSPCALKEHKIKERFRIAGTWAIFNATHSMTGWHIDAAGSSTHFVIKSGQKAWTIEVGGNIAGVLLQAGDAAVMAPNVRHCVYTPEQSICVGGHGWGLSEIQMAHEGLKREAKDRSNETIPLCYPVMVYFGLQLTLDEDVERKYNLDKPKVKLFRSIVRECLETNFLQHSGQPKKASAYAKQVLADYGWAEILPVLKFCERPAAVAACRLHELDGEEEGQS